MTELNKRRVLNVGGNNKAIKISAHYDEFDHLLADIDAGVKPDVLIDARELATLEPQQFDAVYCSHNLEHFFAHDVGKVLGGFRHVLKADGFVEIRVPNLGALMRHLVENNLDLDDVLYQTGAGHPITARDVFYGWGREIERSGVDFYAHKTGFSQKTLQKALNQAGFSFVVFRPGRVLEIYALAFVDEPTSFHQELLGFNLDN
ncbi:MAG: class I SAM-dependent methyltransferase [Hyphomicrobiales bacterium]